MFFNKPRYFVQLAAAEITGTCQCQRVHPIFSVRTTLRDVNVHRFDAIEAKKEEAIPSEAREKLAQPVLMVMGIGL